MNPRTHQDNDRDGDTWLDELLGHTADTPPPDNGFSARVMQRVDALAAAGVVASQANCIAPSAALYRLSVVTRRERRRQLWNIAGVVAAAGVGLLTLWSEPAPVTVLALAAASAALPWLLLRDPHF